MNSTPRLFTTKKEGIPLTAKKQTKTTLEQEILTLICHGILHLFGFDHLTKKDYDFVVSIQNQVIKKL